MRIVRIFVSSPNDALDERRRVSRVVERLNWAYQRSVKLEAVRWEERFYSAHDGFQPQIPRSGECDLVLAILRGRLGSPLSEAFHDALPPQERLPGGASYPSGTAYEILSAIQQRQRGGQLPDIFVFRWPKPPQISLDAPDRTEVEAQWSALKRFAEDVFLTKQGHFKGAYQTYSSLDDFEMQVESLIRDWLKAHVLDGRAAIWPTERGSPFRGLEPFGMRHADVFFGRTREIDRAVGKLKLASEQGEPFQLVVGPSGAGKSSFVRAGLVPRLIVPGEVEGTGTWRMVLMRPGESPEGPVAALAQRLFEGTAEIEAAEAGRPIALPELRKGDFPTPDALARLLAHADETSTAPLIAALSQVAETEKNKWNTEFPLPARLLIVVDQLDEIFAKTITDEQRTKFGLLLDKLGRTGAIWIVGTLRADFYEAFLKSPLAVLGSDERILTLKPPGLAEMAEIVREPAQAADLTWETDRKTGERLDERLLADIDRPDLLPLLQFVLDHLYEKREGGTGQPLCLTFSAYKELGTLDGALDKAGQQALAGLGASEKANLPRLLRSLIAPAAASGGTTTLTLQSVRRAQAAPDEESLRLISALVNARLLVTSVDKQGEPLVSLAHQRVIEAWEQARKIIAGSMEFYRIHSDITTQRKRWEKGKRQGGLLLPRGLSLAEAEQLVTDHFEELPSEDVAFVRLSRRRANRALTFFGSLTFVFAIITLTAVLQWMQAERAQRETEAQRSLAELQRSRAQNAELQATKGKEDAEAKLELSKKVVSRISDKLIKTIKNKSDIELDVVRSILSDLENAVLEIVEFSPNDLKIRNIEYQNFSSFGSIYASKGDLKTACSYFEKAVSSVEAAQKITSDRYDLATAYINALVQLEWCKEMSGDLDGALSILEQSQMALKSPNNGISSHARNATLLEVKARSANIKREKGDFIAAAHDYVEMLPLAREVAAFSDKKQDDQHNLTISLGRAIWAKMYLKDFTGAFELAYEKKAIIDALLASNPHDTSLRLSSADNFEEIGRIKNNESSYGEAISNFGQAREIYEKLVNQDNSNVEWSISLAYSYYHISGSEIKIGLAAKAIADIDKSLEIIDAILIKKPDNYRSIMARLNVLTRKANIEMLSDQRELSLKSYRELLDMRKRLVEKYPTNKLLADDYANLVSYFAGIEKN